MQIKIKYFSEEIERLTYIAGKSDWIDLRAAKEVELKKGEFALIPLNTEYDAGSRLKNGRLMPVPCSYNDIYEGRQIRDHVGEVVYERFFDAPDMLRTGKLMLHFGSVTHAAKVWLNGEYLGSHKGGYLPFAFDITEKVRTCGNRLTVVANNMVDYTTLPCHS